MSGTVPVADCPYLARLVQHLDDFLRSEHGDFFGNNAKHPILNPKPSKVVHDNLWGTNEFSWAELCLIDSPIFQRLRDIHQVGLAFQVYPSARHTRFEHCLGVATIASRIFDVIADRNSGELTDIVTSIYKADADATIRRLRQELRLAALLHDTGHSLYSHASERVYQSLSTLKAAQNELKMLVGKRKGAGEVLSFCLASTESVADLLLRAKSKVAHSAADATDGEIDFQNVALMIVGRASHPHLQFLGDIVSSGFDADKLDYLLRDASAAGLPLRYDLDRYLYRVALDKNILVDGEGELERLYGKVSPVRVHKLSPQPPRSTAPFYETYRLRVPRTAMNAVEQIIICKMMLFSYLYHHTKVRAAEGLLERMLKRMVRLWQAKGEGDESIIDRFFRMTDSSIRGVRQSENSDTHVREYAYRISNRLLPREVYRLNGDAATHAQRPYLTDFLTNLQDKDQKEELISSVEKGIGEELNKLGIGTDPEDALCRAGVWLDVPSPPKFEDVEELVFGGGSGALGAPFVEVFPVGQWTQAYTHFRYPVRIFAFSEYVAQAEKAAKRAMQEILGIHSDGFYEKVKRSRK